MNAIAKDLDDRLRDLDPQTAAHGKVLASGALLMIDEAKSRLRILPI